MKLDLLRRDCFHVELDGASVGGFVRCGGIAGGVGVFEYGEGGFDGVRRFPDRPEPGRILLERGLTRDRTLWEWFLARDPRDGAVVHLDAGGKETMRWTFREGWPCRWEGPKLDARATDVALERLEIVHEGLEWQIC